MKGPVHEQRTRDIKLIYRADSGLWFSVMTVFLFATTLFAAAC